MLFCRGNMGTPASPLSKEGEPLIGLKNVPKVQFLPVIQVEGGALSFNGNVQNFPFKVFGENGRSSPLSCGLQKNDSHPASIRGAQHIRLPPIPEIPINPNPETTLGGGINLR